MVMKTFNWIDLRHCQRRLSDDRQRPTHYGYLTSIATGFLLQEMGLTPTHWLTSDQARAVQLGFLISRALELDFPAVTLPSLGHLRTDLGTDHYLRFIHEAEAAGVTSKIRALQTPWVRQRLFDRSTVAFNEIGQWLNDYPPTGSVILLTSHGYAVAMRHLRVKQLANGILLKDQLPKSISPDDIEGGMFAHCEGAIYRDLNSRLRSVRVYRVVVQLIARVSGGPWCLQK